MKSMYIVAAVLAVAAAQYYEEPQHHEYPEWYVSGPELMRARRELSRSIQVGDNGKLTGALGSTDQALYGKASYAHTLMDNDRGKLDALVSGTRVLTPNGNGNIYGAGLDYKTDHAKATFDYSKMMHGPETYSLGAGGRWPIGKNGDLSAQGYYSHTPNFRDDYGGRAIFNYRF